MVSHDGSRVKEAEDGDGDVREGERETEGDGNR